MIRHSVYFKFKPDADETARAQHIRDFARLPDLIPEIAGYEAGLVVAGPAARPDGTEFDVAHQVMFHDLAGLEVYVPHAAHREFGDRNRASWERVMVVDSEVS